MASLVSSLVLALTLCVVAQAFPVFPDQYYVKGVFSIPYFNISEPIEVWYDAINNQQVISYYNGMDITISIENTTWSIFPEVDTLVCEEYNMSMGLVSMFPDLSYYTLLNGTTEINNIVVQTFQSVFSNWSATTEYNMYMTTAGVPIQLYLDGVDYIFDSHPDIYIMDYGLYLPDYFDGSAFDIPDICQNAKVVDSVPNRGLAGKIFSALSNQKLQKPQSKEEVEFQSFMRKYNKQYANEEEYRARFNTYKETVHFITTHNADATKNHKVAINQFADMSHDEFRSKITPKVKRPTDNYATYTHEPTPVVDLPTYVDWREKGAVTPVKDQGVCGSCYAFGSVGSLEGAYQIKTGKLISLSEQQVVDCAWNDAAGVQGCNGGFASAVMQWWMDNGGVATEASYPYLMQDGYCKAADHSSGVFVKAYVNVTAGEDDLLSAVALGPVAVAIDASHPEFRYYTSGVYYQADCGNTTDDLDHEVLAVGYGTYDGQDYWLVKNSWSTHWGDQGYVMMSRNRGNNCGIATQPNFPIAG